MAKGKAIEWTAYAMRKEAELRAAEELGQKEMDGKKRIWKKEPDSAGKDRRVM